MLNAFASLKCSKKCEHNVQRPTDFLPSEILKLLQVGIKSLIGFTKQVHGCQK